MKPELQNIIKERQHSTYQKLRGRFLKSMKSGTFQEKSSKRKHRLVEKLKHLEEQLGFKSTPKLKHWAMAVALGFVTVIANGQDTDTSKKTGILGRREVRAKSTPLSNVPKVSNVAEIALFESQDFFGDPLMEDGVYLHGDMDGDGDEDLVVFNYSGTLDMLQNDGAGNFDNRIVISNVSSNYLDNTLITDIDADGDLDLLALNSSYDSYGTPTLEIHTYLNDGTGLLSSTSQTIADIGANNDFEIVDINGDGNSDIITGSYSPQNGSSVITLINDGTGSFSLGSSIGSSTEFILGDFDGDSDLDIVVSDYFVRVYTNDGSGGFAPANYILNDAISNAYFEQGDAGDLDGNGTDDIVLSYYNSGVVVLYNTEGTGIFDTPDTLIQNNVTTDFARRAYLEHLIDIDKDGDLDIVYKEEYRNYLLFEESDSFTALYNDGIGTFTPSQLPITTNGGSIDALSIFDVDGDSDLDLIASNYFDIVVYKNTAQTFTLFRDDFTTVFYGLRNKFVDIDNDDDLDVIISGTPAVFENDGKGNLTIKQDLFRDFNAPLGYALVVGDFDSDGDIDIMLGDIDGFQSNLTLWTNDGTGTFTEGTPISLTGEVFQTEVADLDGDGDLDIVTISEYLEGTYYLMTHFNESGVFTTNQTQFINQEIKNELQLVDIDGDGNIDIISGGSNGVVIITNDAGTLASTPTTYLDGIGGEFDKLIIGDIDADSDLDIIALNSYISGGAPHYLLTNDGLGVFSSEVLPFSPTAYYGGKIADFDLDGDVDILILGGEEYEDEFWANDGAGAFTLAGTLGTSSYDADYGDIDGDGDLDIIALQYYAGSHLILNTTNEPVLIPTIAGSIMYNDAPVTDGQVVLYQMSVGPFVPVDTVAIVDGAFSFENVADGAYILETKADPTLYPDALPTYGSTGEPSWTLADTIFFAESMDPTTIIISTFVPPSVEVGALLSASVSNTISAELNEGIALVISRSDTENGTYIPYDYKETDASGNIDFGAIGTGFYSAELAYPGLISPELVFEVADANLLDEYVLDATISFTSIDISTTIITPSNTITKGDSTALVRLYNNLGGPEWANADTNGWLSTTADTWAGVTIDADKRVSKLDLAESNLVGKFPALEELDQLDTLIINNNDLGTNAIDSLGLNFSLIYLDASSNNLDTIPNFGLFELMTYLDVSNNNLTFEELVPNAAIANYTYTEQAIIGQAESDTLAAGSSIEISVPDLGIGTVYQWKFGKLIPGQNINTDVVELADQVNRNLLIENINFDNQGTYILTATHPSVPELTLISEPLNVWAKTNLFGAITTAGNPLTDGDVIILRLTPSGPFVAEDTVELSTTGTYEFSDVILGDFLINVKPNREVFENTIQTYYIKEQDYEDADTLKLRQETTGVNIEMIVFTPPTTTPPPSQAKSITGIVETNFQEDGTGNNGNRIDARRKVKRAACSVRRFVPKGRTTQEGDFVLYAYVESNDNGEFQFTNLEAGTYRLRIEYPGVPMDEDSDVEFVLEGSNVTGYSVLATVTEDGIFVESSPVLGTPSPFLNEIKVYPNPVKETAQLRYTVNRKISSLNFKLLSIDGKIISNGTLGTKTGTYDLKLNTENLDPGIYFVNLYDTERNFSYQVKLIKE